eukprot:scaffold6866_cov118-Isochrysis_galbana.AAC.2
MRNVPRGERARGGASVTFWRPAGTTLGPTLCAAGRAALALLVSGTMPEGGVDLVGLVRGATAEEVVEALASWPGGVNGLSVDGESPVVACAEVGRVALLKSLLAANASPDAACTSGLSVLAAAAMTGNLECVQLLLEAGAAPDEPCGALQVTPLSYAAQEGYRGVAEALIDAGADATRPDFFGATPIAYATRRAEENRVRNFNFHT